MNFCRRLFATKVPQPPASPTTPPYLTTSPRAVRLRRARFPPKPIIDGGVHMSPSDQRRYQRLKLRGSLGKGDNVISPEKWIEQRNKWRSRVRGVQYGRAKPTDQAGSSERIVGQRIYLPNIVFRLIRNSTPPGKPYNPYIATFRVPKEITKLDIRSYLSTVYGVPCTFIRTENFVSRIVRSLPGRRKSRGSNRTYKRATVGLVDPFYYPEAKEDMNVEERQKRVKWEEDNFQREETIRLRNASMAGSFRGWRTRGDFGREKILKAVMQQRVQRESLVAEAVTDMKSRRPRV